MRILQSKLVELKMFGAIYLNNKHHTQFECNI